MLEMIHLSQRSRSAKLLYLGTLLTAGPSGLEINMHGLRVGIGVGY